LSGLLYLNQAIAFVLSRSDAPWRAAIDCYRAADLGTAHSVYFLV